MNYNLQLIIKKFLLFKRNWQQIKMNFVFNFQQLPIICQIQILLFVDKESFTHISKTKELKYLFTYPNSERLYEERSKLYCNCFMKHKDNEKTWNQFYNYCCNPREYYARSDIVKEGNLTELKIHHEIYKPLHGSYILNEQCNANYYGHLHILEYYESFGIKFDTFDANESCIGGHLHILEFLIARNAYPNEHGANEAAKRGHLHILKFLATYNLYPENIGFQMAIGNEHEDIVEWLLKTKRYSDTIVYINQRMGSKKIENLLKEYNVMCVTSIAIRN